MIPTTNFRETRKRMVSVRKGYSKEQGHLKIRADGKPRFLEGEGTYTIVYYERSRSRVLLPLVGKVVKLWRKRGVIRH